MELEKMKEIWRSIDAPVKSIPFEDPNSIFSKKSSSLIGRMKRSLFMELIAILFLYSGAIIYFFISGFGSIALLLALLFMCFLFYYYMKNRLLEKMSCISCAIKSNLQLQLKQLQRYQKWYARATAVLTPLSFIAGWIVLADVHGLQFPLYGRDLIFFILFLTLGVTVSVATYFLNKIYVEKLYGRQIYTLKKLLNEIEEM